MHQSALRALGAVIEGPLESVQGKLGVQRLRDAPSHDPPHKGTDNKGNVDEATPCRNVG